MSPTYVQSATSSPFVSGTSASATYGSNVTKGNLLVCAAQTNLGTDATTISDTQGSVWTHLINQPSPPTPGTEGDLWFAIAKSSGSNTVTVHSSVAAYIGAVVAEYSGVNAVDGTALGNQSEASSQNFITSAAAEVLIAFFSAGGGGVTTMGGGFTLRQSISLSGVVYFVFGDYIVASKGTYAATCNATNPEWSVIAGFKNLNGAGLLLGIG